MLIFVYDHFINISYVDRIMFNNIQYRDISSNKCSNVDDDTIALNSGSFLDMTTFNKHFTSR